MFSLHVYIVLSLETCPIGCPFTASGVLSGQVSIIFKSRIKTIRLWSEEHVKNTSAPYTLASILHVVTHGMLESVGNFFFLATYFQLALLGLAVMFTEKCIVRNAHVGQCSCKSGVIRRRPSVSNSQVMENILKRVKHANEVVSVMVKANLPNVRIVEESS